MSSSLPILNNIASIYIWLPISSCAVERSFSVYNNLLEDDRQNLSEDSLKMYILINEISKFFQIFNFLSPKY